MDADNQKRLLEANAKVEDVKVAFGTMLLETAKLREQIAALEKPHHAALQEATNTLAIESRVYRTLRDVRAICDRFYGELNKSPLPTHGEIADRVFAADSSSIYYIDTVTRESGEHFKNSDEVPIYLFRDTCRKFDCGLAYTRMRDGRVADVKKMFAEFFA
jgi:hypothetical protein